MQLSFFSKILFLFVCCIILAWQLKAKQPVNNAPKVVIIKPLSTERFNWNALVKYEIAVADKEDGNSAYNEIAANEVFLKIKYLPDSANIKTYLLAEAKKPEPQGLQFLKASTCFTCHSIKNKLIGPSYEAIAKKYSGNINAVSMLATKVMRGSKGVWGEQEMPPNSNIEKNKATEIISWIMKNAADSTVDYLPGLEGIFHTKVKPVKNAAKGVYVLTASYADHGMEQNKQTLQGKQSIVMRSN